MKLILTSGDFGNARAAKAIRDNLGMPIEDCRVLYFPNEKATKERIESDLYYDRVEQFGFRRENIAVFNYYAPEPFFTRPYDAIYVSGGNTFGTIKRIRESGADRLITDLVGRGTVYIGGSAGAHIVTADLAHVAKYDTNTHGLTDFSGLGLHTGILLCHYSDARRPHLEELQATSPYPVTPLADDEWLIVEG